MFKKLISLVVIAGAFCGLAVYAAQDATLEQREVRDPRQLETYLESNAADAESRLAVIESVAVGGGSLSAGKVIVGNVTNVAHAVTMSGDATINSNGVLTLAGNIPVARLTNAVATIMPAFASGTFYVVNTTQLVFTAGAVTNIIDADITK